MKKILLLTCFFLLSGCLSSTPSSRFYLLESSQTQSDISGKKFNLAVQDIAIPQYLDRPQIVLQRQNNPELKIAEFDRWASDLSTMLQNIMIDDLQNALPNTTIKRLAYGNNPRYIIKFNIEKFSGWLGEDAYIKGNWQILNAGNRILYQENINLHQKIGKDYNSYVQAQSQLWSQVAPVIAKQLAKM